MVMYEINTLNIEAEGTTESLRSTFVDLWDGPGATRTPRWNLGYARGLGVNWLWFQPIHPIGIDGRHLSAADINNRNVALGYGNPNATTWRWNAGSPFEDVNYPYAFGSPYAVKNFFEVEPRMSKANTRPAAMQEFQDFVAAADNGRHGHRERDARRALQPHLLRLRARGQRRGVFLPGRRARRRDPQPRGALLFAQRQLRPARPSAPAASPSLPTAATSASSSTPTMSTGAATPRWST
jgi:hypothetical protein